MESRVLSWLCLVALLVAAAGRQQQQPIQPRFVERRASAVTVACPSNCNGNGFCLAGRCQCKQGFGGLACEKQVCVNACSGNGACNATSGVCQCNPGFYGQACETHACPHNCYGQGYCRKHTCICYSDFEGVNCKDWKGCPNRCNGNGECKKQSCWCKEGWTGRGCDRKVCPSDCNGRGVCNTTSGTCNCESNYFGAACERHRCPDNCSGKGLCDTTTGVCKCNPGFYGVNCSPMNCMGNCSGHGICLRNTTKQTARCLCQPGWVGDGCQQVKCPNKCGASSGHGNCTTNGCVCSAKWKGPACDKPRCPFDCTDARHGSCDNSTWKCTCLDGWTGPACANRICPQSCNFRGVCLNGTCSCDDWWTGKRCEVPRCKVDSRGRVCGGHGRCVLPHIDKTPAQQMDSALKKSTQTTNQLKAALKGFMKHPERAHCVCDVGWRGSEDCTFKQCPNDCAGRGICLGGKCFCKKGYFGEDCSLVQSLLVPKRNQSALIASYMSCKQRCQNGKCLLSSKPAVTSQTKTKAQVVARVANDKAVYQCFCEVGWGGPNCDKSQTKCAKGCMNVDGSCKKNCNAASECPSLNGQLCGGRGKCVKGVCQCDHPWAGDACGTAQCPQNCNNRGYCQTSTGKCLCPAGWGGKACGIKLFDTN